VEENDRLNNWNETVIAKEILSKKYYHDGENFDDFVKRVSGIFSDKIKTDMYYALYNADFLPAGRSLYGAGSKGKFKASMSNCYIMPMPEDNIESIFDIASKMARISSYGGGVGLNVSKLRPNGAKVNNSAKTSSGAVSFLNIFDSVGQVIGSNGRRNAMIVGLNCTHPDIEEFLEIKRNNDKIQSANISILFTDKFMQAVKGNKSFELYFKVEATGEEIKKTINAKEFFMKFCEAQFDYAEPGALFIDKIRSYNILSGYPEDEYRINISNPCAEYVGSAYNACNLGSINLYNLVQNPFTKKASIDWDKFAEKVKLGVIALDEILDYGYDSQPLPENKQAIDDWRAIGLGVFGLGDMLVALGIRYGSDESVKLIEKIMKFMFHEAVRTSAILAREKGTFGKYNWEYVKDSPLIKALDTEIYNMVKHNGLRNGSLLSIAPTGSISTMCGISGGVEPLFSISYERTTHSLSDKEQYFKVFAKSVEDLLKYNGYKPDEMTNEQIKLLFPYVASTHDINSLDRIKVQAAMQKWVDNAISSTVNMNNNVTIDDVYNTYIAAWENGCKGMTIFRDGCKRTAILVTSVKPKESEIIPDSVIPAKRRNVKKVNGSTIKKSSACAPSMYVTINNKDGEIFEVFTNSSGGCKSNISSITRLVSLLLRAGVKVETVIEELKENPCPACHVLKQQGNKDVSNSCGSCIAEAIEEIYQELKEPIEKDTNDLLECPECSEKTLRPEGKCFNCSNCGYSKCD
jgi:ribonucleoside-diphosphate reductase alpha chain